MCRAMGALEDIMVRVSISALPSGKIPDKNNSFIQYGSCMVTFTLSVRTLQMKMPWLSGPNYFVDENVSIP